LATQIYGQLLDSFALKEGKKIRCFILSVYSGKFSDLQFADCSPKKFAGLQFAGSIKRNLRI
jgi:hypothetical protein